MESIVKLHVLGSSSAGNCYLLEAVDGTLMIEAGVNFTLVKQALGYNLRQLCGCVVSHRHRDHGAFVSAVMKNGIRVLAPKDVFEGLNYAKIPNIGEAVQTMRWYNIGPFRVFAFYLFHDVYCVGYVVEHKDMGRLLFVTDTMMCEYVFGEIDHLMIEANYSDDLLDGNIKAGIEPVAMKDRLLHSHMELGTTVDVINCNKCKSGQSDVILIHLSSRNSDAEAFKDRVAKATGILPYVAVPGLVVPLSKDNPY